jgi:1-acyl-sn-glycerol-3-phosphate acyltransferase
MIEKMLQYGKAVLPDTEKLDEIYQQLERHYANKSDPWGLSLKQHRRYFEILWPLYQYYFRVKFHNKSRVKNKPYIIIANHSGQIAIDAMLVMMGFTYEISPPRVVRGMIERFFPKIPFLGELASRAGNIVGDRKNCCYLLSQGETVLVFPEGVGGISKSSANFYKLQNFTTGFFRMALSEKVEILPMAIVGAEEFYPYVLQLTSLAKFLRLPALPITPTFPWLGPLGLLPMPSPVDIYIGKPYSFPKDLTADASDDKINNHVGLIKKQIQTMIDQGLKKKRNYLGEAENAKKH